MSDGRFALDVSSEVRRSGLIQHFAEFSLSLHACMVVQVQVAAELTRGLLTPRLQLFSLTPTLDVCLEHRAHPAQCFAKLTALTAATSTTYVDEAAYQRRWLPILALEAAETAVASQASAIIHMVSVVWRHRPVAGEAGGEELGVVGHLALSHTFCQERRILLSGDCQSLRQDLGLFGLEKSAPAPADLLCVRYTGLELPEDAALDERVAAIVKTGSASASWVGHCVVEAVEREEWGGLGLSLSLQSSSARMPTLLLDSSVAAQLPCTLEWIPKTSLFRSVRIDHWLLRTSQPA
ncbi:MAG: hypothetical protein KAG66_03185 [Methylococcales bacterium]|nr:hypothetical protein [Methylococcales bacterium]